VSERVFLDTNLLVYADDADAGQKQRVARERIRSAIEDRTGVISTQVLQDYFSVATRKLGITAAAARRRVELLSVLDVVRIEVTTILAAIDLHRLHPISFWDALIVRAASLAGCARLLSEDLQAGSTIDGVRVEDPFAGAR
jgi:predicted nucleic acid-binding protein